MKLTSLAQSALQPVSHNVAINKQVLIAAGDVAAVTQFARAEFPPGETAPGHCHIDMTEVFFIESGCGEIEVDGTCFPLQQGSCVAVAPGEWHELRNTGGDSMCVLYFGVECISGPK